MDIKNRIIGIIIGIVFIFGIITFYYTFSLGDEYRFSSEVYLVEDGYVKGVSPYTSISLFKKYFDYSNCYIKVVDKSNKEISSGYIYNGSKTVLYDDSNHVISSYTNIVYGDYFADGIIDDKDYSFFGKYLVYANNLENYEKEALDINRDGEVRINDLVMLRDAVNNGVSSLSINKEEVLLQTNEKYRLVVSVNPLYGVNSNLKWSSSDNSIASVNDAGVITGGSVEGHAIIKAETQDGKKQVLLNVNLDNTIQLSSANGVGYVNGSDVSVNIKSVTYDDLTCSVSNSSVASCRIDGKKLVMTGLTDGSTEVHVNSNLYNGATYYLQSHTVYFRVMPNYLCTSYNNISYATVSGFYTGNLSFDSTDAEIITEVGMAMVNNRNMLKMVMGSKTGRANVTVTEDHANTSGIVTVDVYNLSFSEMGKVVSKGEVANVEINDGNLGELSCTSDKEDIATCSIDGNRLVINGISDGFASLKIKNTMEFEGSRYSCGEKSFGVLVRE